MTPGSTWTQKPCPNDVAAIARKLVGLANAVPPAHWVTYGNWPKLQAWQGQERCRGAASALDPAIPGAAVERASP
jgi:hypothetical protein